MSLYTINEAIENFEPEVDPETGELLNAGDLDSLLMERDVKIENICLFIKNLTAESKAIKEEVKSLNERAKAKENKAERLKQYLERCLNGEKFETAACKVSWRKSEKAEIDDGFVVWAMKYHDDLLRYTNPTPDKDAIKAAIKAGEDIPGARLVQTNNMTIK